MNGNQRIVLITGAAKGIGFQIAREFGINNYEVVLLDRQEERFWCKNNSLEP